MRAFKSSFESFYFYLRWECLPEDIFPWLSFYSALGWLRRPQSFWLYGIEAMKPYLNWNEFVFTHWKKPILRGEQVPMQPCGFCQLHQHSPKLNSFIKVFLCLCKGINLKLFRSTSKRRVLLMKIYRNCLRVNTHVHRMTPMGLFHNN